MSTVLGFVVLLFGSIFAYLFHRDTKAPVPATQPPEPPPAPVIEPPAQVEPPAPKPDLVRACALAQQAFEGWYPGSNAFVHNNPGNCKNLKGEFVTFPTYALGLAYLEDYIRRVATGKHPAYPKGGMTTISEYTHIYTSDKEPSPTNYAAAISRATGLSTSSPMWMLVSDKL